MLNLTISKQKPEIWMVIKNMSGIQFEHLFTVSSKCVEKPVPLPRPRKSLAS